jgi:penicillin G amidase
LNPIVEILRDRAGVPHLYADSTKDLYFGLGYATAEDRLWQMDWLRRRALGRQAELLGPAYVQSDLMHRSVGIAEIAEREVELTDPLTREILESFVAGINRYIDQCESDLPTEFKLLEYEPEPFSVRDSLAILRAQVWSLNGRLRNIAIAEAARLLPEELREAYLTPEAPETRILPPDAAYPDAARLSRHPLQQGLLGMGDATGSNNWAVSARRTASGRALLCSDPHQPFWVPSSWYEYAVHGPEDSAAGAAHPGVPGLWWGSNGAIAWGITNNAASTRDLYREEIHPTDSSMYRDEDRWRRFDERTLEIRVRGQAPVQQVQRSTVRGPVVNNLLPTVDAGDDAPLSLRWVGQEHADDVRAIIAIGRARDWRQFREALREWSVPVFNFGYADALGNVGYQCAGRIPIVGRVAPGYRLANEPADQWQGYVPFDGLPTSFNPGRGYIASANERVAPDDYPYALHGSWGSGYRGERIHQTLATTQPFDRDSAVALQNDVKNVRAERLCPRIVQSLEGTSDADVDVLRENLAGWDYRYTLQSVAPILFEAFMDTWQNRVLRARFPERLHELLRGQTGVAARLIERGDLEWFPASTADVRDQMREAAVEAVRRVRTRYGSDKSAWSWGSVHKAHWLHPLRAPDRRWLDIGPEPLDGGAETVRNTGVGPFESGLDAVGGAEYRLVVDFADPEHILAVQNIGNSGRPESPHYRDQFVDWLAGRYHVVSLKREDVERDLESSLRLERSTSVTV